MPGRLKSHNFLALILIIIGVLLLLDNLNIASFGNIIGTWWPVLLIFLGVYQVLSRFGNPFSWVLVLLGSGMLAANLEIITWHRMWSFWPLLLIVFGISIYFNTSNRSVDKKESFDGEEKLDAWVIFGGIDRIVNTKNFRGGNATALFGGIDIDLTQAELAEGVQVLNTNGIFGGVDIRVPEHWKVEINALPILGAVEDKRRTGREVENNRCLRINALGMLGGVEIKN